MPATSSALFLAMAGKKFKGGLGRDKYMHVFVVCLCGVWCVGGWGVQM